jgi:transcriptional regulator with XRE-family HTH domain
METVGEVLLRLRESAGLSQQALADRAGVSPTSVSGCEAGARVPSPAVLGKLAAALGVPADALAGATRPNVSPPSLAGRMRGRKRKRR